MSLGFLFASWVFFGAVVGLPLQCKWRDKMSNAPIIILSRQTPVAFELACNMSVVGVFDKEGTM